MQRGISGKTRRGAPPLGRQRLGLRIVQLTLAALAVFIGILAFRAYGIFRDPPDAHALQMEGARYVEVAEVIVLGALAAISGAGSMAMGLRAVRGPEPPPISTERGRP